MIMPDNDFLAVAVHAAITAGTVLRENFHCEHRISFKGVSDLVTEMDRRVEHIIIEMLRSRFPDIPVIAEEDGQVGTEGELFWLVDPLDGTTNYAHGFPWYAVSIGLYRTSDKRARVGVVYHPERDELFTASEGHGAFRNNQPVHVSSTEALSHALVATGFSYSIREEPGPTFDIFSKLVRASRGIRRAGSAALDLCYVACGVLDGFWEARLSPWDTAAGALIVTEAGGRVSTFDGRDYTPYENSILATNGKLHQQMQQLLSVH